MVYKTLHRMLKIEHHESHKTPRVNSGTPEDKVPVSLMAPGMLLLLQSDKS
jgi:hypothetical protein